MSYSIEKAAREMDFAFDLVSEDRSFVEPADRPAIEDPLVLAEMATRMAGRLKAGNVPADWPPMVARLLLAIAAHLEKTGGHD